MTKNSHKPEEHVKGAEEKPAVPPQDGGVVTVPKADYEALKSEAAKAGEVHYHERLCCHEIAGVVGRLQVGLPIYWTLD